MLQTAHPCGIRSTRFECCERVTRTTPVPNVGPLLARTKLEPYQLRPEAVGCRMPSMRRRHPLPLRSDSWNGENGWQTWPKQTITCISVLGSSLPCKSSGSDRVRTRQAYALRGATTSTQAAAVVAWVGSKRGCTRRFGCMTAKRYHHLRR